MATGIADERGSRQASKQANRSEKIFSFPLFVLSPLFYALFRLLQVEMLLNNFVAPFRVFSWFKTSK